METVQPPAEPTGPTVRRHPIRGALWGLLLGLGLALFLVGRKIVALGTITPLLVILAGVALGVLLALLVPPRGSADLRP